MPLGRWPNTPLVWALSLGHCCGGSGHVTVPWCRWWPLGRGHSAPPCGAALGITRCAGGRGRRPPSAVCGVAAANLRRQ
eukprot:3702136-Alexandrium_andersonii.AAC.1